MVRFADVTIDLAAKSVTRAGARVHLTPTEWRMLEFLARNPDALVTRQTLLKEIWASEQIADTGYLRL
ncbi:winged helix-turn-helix domain-containing protein, partial [Acinetobacter baumannii]